MNNYEDVKKVKLSSLEEKQLKETDLTGLLGGACSCGCIGPSSTEDNKTMNINGNLTTPGYSHVIVFLVVLL